MNCAFCPHHKCYTSGQNCTRLTHEEISEYYTDEDKKMMRASSATESRNYLKMTRLEESVFFAKEMGVKKVGIAFCIGLANEAHFCAQYLLPVALFLFATSFFFRTAIFWVLIGGALVAFANSWLLRKVFKKNFGLD